MFEDVFTYKEYVPLDATSSSYTIGGLTNCVDENACGQITLGQEVPLCCPGLVPLVARHSCAVVASQLNMGPGAEVCLGTIHVEAKVAAASTQRPAPQP